MTDQRHRPAEETFSERRRRDGPFAETEEQPTAYFAGELKDFTLDLRLNGTPVPTHGLGPTAPEIPYGETRTYGELADSLGNPAASRAVGLANGRNPIGIIVPCHRVIGARAAASPATAAAWNASSAPAGLRTGLGASSSRREHRESRGERDLPQAGRRPRTAGRLAPARRRRVPARAVPPPGGGRRGRRREPRRPGRRAPHRAPGRKSSAATHRTLIRPEAISRAEPASANAIARAERSTARTCPDTSRAATARGRHPARSRSPGPAPQASGAARPRSRRDGAKAPLPRTRSPHSLGVPRCADPEAVAVRVAQLDLARPGRLLTSARRTRRRPRRRRQPARYTRVSGRASPVCSDRNSRTRPRATSTNAGRPARSGAPTARRSPAARTTARPRRRRPRAGSE